MKKGFFSVTFLIINFYGAFFKTFSMDSKSAWNSAFFDTILNFLIKIFFLLFLALFVNFDCKCPGNGSKKQKIFFMNVSLNFIRQPSQGGFAYLSC